MKGKHNNKLGEGERLVRLGQDRLAIKRKRAETMNVVVPAPLFLETNGLAYCGCTMFFILKYPKLCHPFRIFET